MATVKRFEDLEVWQLAKNLCKKIYEISTKGLFAKDFNSKNQINDAAGSAMDNIAEGFGRAGKYEFIQFLCISNGSVCEVKSQLYRALDKEYITQQEFDEIYALADTLNNKLGSFINYLNKSETKGTKFKNRK